MGCTNSTSTEEENKIRKSFLKYFPTPDTYKAIVNNETNKAITLVD